MNGMTSGRNDAMTAAEIVVKRRLGETDSIAWDLSCSEFDSAEFAAEADEKTVERIAAGCSSCWVAVAAVDTLAVD